MLHNQHIADLGGLLERRGIRHVIISPGSRNAPLIQLFTSHPAFTCYSIVDERSAGYVALGMARQLREPVVVVTTSGTSVLNLSPAVAEAFHQHIPLVILTADRPLEKISRFNNQVIDQEAPYFNHSKGFIQLPFELRTRQELKRALAAVGQLLDEAARPLPGPVHVNIGLQEPLYEKLPEPLPELSKTMSPPVLNEDKPGLIPEMVHKKVLLLAGMGSHEEEIATLLTRLSSSFNVVVIAENIANLHSELFITCPELLLAGANERELKDLAPDVVISFGGQVVSKRLKLFLESVNGAVHMEVEGNPRSVLDELGIAGESGNGAGYNRYLERWKEIESRESERADTYLADAPYSIFTVIRKILTEVPGGTVVHLGNSSTIRYSQLIPVRHDLVYYSNRGTSGIDGSVSAAVGAAMVSDDLHLLLVGDLSFVYDSNAMWNQHFPGNLKIVVLNDGGGGIFRLLKGPDQMEFFEEFSVTHHPVSLELLSQAFGRVFLRADHMKEVEEKMAHLFQSGTQADILEVDATESENSRIFKEFFNLNH